MKINPYFISLLFFYCTCISQGNTSALKAKIDVGLSNPSANGFVENFEARSLNFPTVNLGIQYMLSRRISAKLDYGFSRISSNESALPFKLNYSRINLQGALDVSNLFFIDSKIRSFVHAGPGYTFIKPLGK